MHDPLFVRRGNRVGDLHAAPEDFANRQPAIRDEPVERLSIHVLHDDERGVAMLFDAVDGDAAWMIQRGGGAGLMEQTLGGFFVVQLQHFDGDSAIEQRVAGAIHGTHAAMP